MKFYITIDERKVLESYSIFRERSKSNIRSDYFTTLNYGENFLNESFEKSHERISFDNSIISTMEAIPELSELSTVGC